MSGRRFRWDRALPPVWYWTVFALTVAAGLTLRIVYSRLEPTICPDGPTYIELAGQWLADGVCPEHDYLPLYTWLMTLLMRCGLDGHAAGVWINLAAGTLFIPLVWRLVLAVTGHREAALAAALLAATHPQAIDLAIHVQRDALYLLLAGGVLTAGLEAIRKRPGYAHWALAGALLAAGLFTRYETLELLVPILLYWPLAALAGSLRRKEALLGCGAFCAALVLTCAFLTVALDVSGQMTRAYWGRIERIVAERR